MLSILLFQRVDIQQKLPEGRRPCLSKVLHQKELYAPRFEKKPAHIN